MVGGMNAKELGWHIQDAGQSNQRNEKPEGTKLALTTAKLGRVSESKNWHGKLQIAPRAACQNVE